MGWSRGSDIMSDLISIIRNLEIHHTEAVDVYGQMIDILEHADCDTLEDCLGEDEAYDEAFFNKYPELREEFSDDS
jgi:hypothetical protein